jgi:hypothetical protein
MAKITVWIEEGKVTAVDGVPTDVYVVRITTLTVSLMGLYRKTKKGGPAKFWSGERPNGTS